MPSAKEFKGKKGLTRLWNALGYSRDGIAAAWHHEAAFREEILLATIAIPLAF
jgi:diacylglycerol kinase (ATP)